MQRNVRKMRRRSGGRITRLRVPARAYSYFGPNCWQSVRRNLLSASSLQPGPLEAPEIRMKQLAALSLSLIVTVVGCDRPKAVVALDSRWTVDFAKDTCRQADSWRQANAALISKVGCAKITSCSEMLARVNACALNPVQEVRAFHKDLATQFAVDKACSSIQLVYYEAAEDDNKIRNDAVPKGHYNLWLNYIPGAKRQQWRMNSQERIAFTQGDGSPGDIARQVCSIVKQKATP